jgi:hypothetical protein
MQLLRTIGFLARFHGVKIRVELFQELLRCSFHSGLSPRGCNRESAAGYPENGRPGNNCILPSRMIGVGFSLFFTDQGSRRRTVMAVGNIGMRGSLKTGW